VKFLEEEKFLFESKAVPPDTFGVVRFQGEEGLSRCYRFEIDLVAGKPDLDITEILQKPAVFTIQREEDDVPFHGILSSFEQLQTYNQYYFYRAILVPRLWWLSLTHYNQVFLGKTVPDIVTAVLENTGLTSNDYQLKLKHDYSPRQDATRLIEDESYVCQYQESHFNFISRLMEREGMYYYFHQTDDREVMVITDTTLSHEHMPQGGTMHYSPPSGLDAVVQKEVIKSLSCRQHMIPQKVMVKDYNYRTPSLEMTGKADVSPQNGRGEVFVYGDHFQTPKEGDRMAAIRAEEFRSREKEFVGESVISFLRPGYVFDLDGHFRDDYNQKYLTVDLSHQGTQAGYLVAGLSQTLSEAERRFHYSNSFRAMPADTQYRPPIQTPKPRFYGTINARVDASGSGKYAEVDKYGRYKIKLPFDVSDRDGGKASTWLRMAQPYAGSDHGMHFPLHKGTEVLLTFIDGNPDRPIIAATVPNLETPSMITNANATNAGFRTGGGTSLTIQDKEGSERISLHAGDGKSSLVLGAGSPSTSTSTSAHQCQASDYTWSAVSGGVASMFSERNFSATVGPLAEAVALGAYKKFIEDYQKQDELGKQGEEDKDEDKDEYWTAAVWPYVQQYGLGVIWSLVTSITLSKSFTKWAKDAALGFPKGEKAKAQGKKESKSWLQKIEDTYNKLNSGETVDKAMEFILGQITGLPGTLNTTFRGGFLTYGAAMYTSHPSDGLKAFIDPRNVSSLNLGNEPDLLLASGNGKVDIFSEKGINAFTAENVNAKGKEVKLRGEQIILSGESDGIIQIDADKNEITTECCHSSMTFKEKEIEVKTPKKMTIEITGKIPVPAVGDVELPEVIKDYDLEVKVNKNVFKVAQDSILLDVENKKAFINLDQSGQSAHINGDKSVQLTGENILIGGTSMATKGVTLGGNNVEIKGATKVDIKSTTAVNLDCPSGIKISSKSIKLG
jgi:type VI secretion system VgrG family protein